MVGLASTEVDISSKVDPKTSQLLSCSDQQGHGECAEQKSLFSTGTGTADALEATAEKKEKGVFTPPEWAWKADRASLQCPDTATVLPIRDQSETTNPFPADKLTAVRWSQPW